MAGLLAVGLLASVGHLGRPLRGYLALARVGSSPLSTEVSIVAVVVIAALLGVFLPAQHLSCKR